MRRRARGRLGARRNPGLLRRIRVDPMLAPSAAPRVVPSSMASAYASWSAAAFAASLCASCASRLSLIACCSGVSADGAAVPNLAARAARFACSAGSKTSMPATNSPRRFIFFSAASLRIASTSLRLISPRAMAFALGSLYSCPNRSARLRAFSFSASRTAASWPDAACSAATSSAQSKPPPPVGRASVIISSSAMLRVKSNEVRGGARPICDRVANSESA